MADAVAFFDGRLMPLKEANINIATHAFNYGTGVFEGIRAYWNEEQEELYIVQPGTHFRRMQRSARLLQIDLPYSEERLVRITQDLLRANGFQEDVYIRPLAYKADAVIKVGLSGISSGFAMFAVPMGDYVSMTGIHVAVSSWRRISDNMIPSRAKVVGAYVNAALSSDQARLDGYDEAIMLADDGHVSEASSSNLFMVRNETLITPPVTADILEGVTRQLVFELADDLKIACEVRNIDRTELYSADELFLCGTGVQLASIVTVDRRPVNHGHPGPITQALQKQYLALVRGQLPAHRHQVTPVYRPRNDA
ncbi:MAG: branched chain amino acid aminotransferase [Sulfobacillus acidophilus]|uniref:Branched-chain-amino-acid aminotransferase n=1 Tax=Sulfobacillus acidophilus TaxID=53633 RepID=A0A2T2WPM0_9FIRM|nr:MAG: branched chain amino acid aminotransferase [Sulfobacillus acidophilus]